MLLRPPAGRTLEAVLEDAPDWDAALGAVFTLAREECVVEAARRAGEAVSHQHEVVAVDGFLGRPRQHLAHLARTSSPSRAAAPTAE